MCTHTYTYTFVFLNIHTYIYNTENEKQSKVFVRRGIKKIKLLPLEYEVVKLLFGRKFTLSRKMRCICECIGLYLCFCIILKLYEFDEEIYYRHIVNDNIKDL